LGDWFPFGTYFLTSQASPNDPGIVVVVIIVIGEARLVLHIGGIIAQTLYLNRACLPGNNQSKALGDSGAIFMQSRCKVPR
jgi:hypothetical protein